MTNDEHDATAAVRQLARAVVPVEKPQDTSARRVKLVPALEEVVATAATRHRAGQRRRVWWGGLALAAALALALGGAWMRHNPLPGRPLAEANLAPGPVAVEAFNGGIHIQHDGSEAFAQRDSRLDADDELRTDAGGHATLLFRSGARIALAGETRVRVVRADALPTRSVYEELELTWGHIDVSVPKLGETGTLRVRTPDTVVQVHGTRFSVDVTPGGAENARASTVVHVTAGLVSVDHDGNVSMLGAGARWSSAAIAGSQGGTVKGVSEDVGRSKGRASKATAPAGGGRGAAAAKVAEGAPPAPVRSASSTLAAENALFQSAMAAARAGRDKEALALLERLLAAYPASPLAQNARVERFRLLASMGEQGAATREARRYLADHPEGFAREEARDVLMPAPAGSTP